MWTDACNIQSVAESSTDCKDIDRSCDSKQQPTRYLPPCRICTRKASGFHYGVNTCEACKGFFRRSLRRFEKGLDVTYTCEKDKNCQIEGERIMCSFCRYQKCLKEGMSKTAIKQGRYSHAMKTQYTIEIKGVDVPSIKVEAQDLIVEQELDDLLQKLITVEETYDPGFRNQFVNKEIYYKKQKEIYDKQCILPNKNPTSTNDHSTLDGYTDEKKTMLEMITSGLDAVVRYLVDFVKCIPGFRELSMTDQSSLLKASFLEFGFTGDCFKFNPEMGVMLGLLDMPVEKINTHLFPDRPDLPEDLLKYCKKMQQLHVTCEELTLLRAILILFTDRCELDNPSKVSDIQWKLIEYLQHITKHSKNRLGRLLELLTSLRTLQLEKLLDCVNDFRVCSPFIKKYPIIHEVISTVCPT